MIFSRKKDCRERGQHCLKLILGLRAHQVCWPLQLRISQGGGTAEISNQGCSNGRGNNLLAREGDKTR